MTSSQTQAWLKDLPIDWGVKKIRAIFYSRDERNTDLQEDNILSVMKDIGVIRYEDKGNVGNKSSDRPENYKIVYPNDIVANSMNLVIGSLGIAKEKGVTSSVYHILAKRDDGVLPEFYEYVMRSKAFQRYAGSLGKGIMELREAVRWEVLRNIEVPIPDSDTQHKIVEYLDKKLEKIDQFIRNKEAYIERLAERKQVIISEALSRGLDATIATKPTGVGWLGDIPQHWQLRKLKYCIKEKLKYGANEAGEAKKDGWPRYIRITDFGSSGHLKDGEYLCLNPDIGKDYLLSAGDILFARSGATVGKAYQFVPMKDDELEYCFAGYLIKASPNPKIILSDFLYAYTSSHTFENWKNTIFNKATIENIGADKYSTLLVPIPPLDEQKIILKHIFGETKIIDKATKKTEQQIDLIKEYRDSLITNVVTGQIKIGE